MHFTYINHCCKLYFHTLWKIGWNGKKSVAVRVQCKFLCQCAASPPTPNPQHTHHQVFSSFATAWNVNHEGKLCEMELRDFKGVVSEGYYYRDRYVVNEIQGCSRTRLHLSFVYFDKMLTRSLAVVVAGMSWAAVWHACVPVSTGSPPWYCDAHEEDE